MQQPSDKSASQPKRIGDLFVESGLLKAEDLQKGLDYGRKTGMPLGRVLVMLRLANDADLRSVLHVQQLMKFEGMPGNLAVRALSYMREKKVHIEWAVKQIGWESDKFKKDLPGPLREIKDKIADAESRLGADHPEIAGLMLEMVDFYVDEKMWAHAEATSMLALGKLEKAHGSANLKVADAALKVSDVLFLQDQYEEALSLAQKGLEIRQKMLGEDHFQVGAALKTIGEIHDVQRRFGEAERCYMQALTVLERIHDCDDDEILYLLRQLGHACRRAGRTSDTMMVGTLLTEAGLVDAAKVPAALAYAKENGVPMARALVMMELLSEKDLRPVLHAQLLIRSNLIPAAIAVRTLRIGAKRRISLEDAMEVVGWRLQQGRNYEFSELLQTHDDLLNAESTLPSDHPDVGALCLRMAHLFETYDRFADAEPLYKRALAIMEKSDSNADAIMEILDRLAWVYVRQQKFELAESIYFKVLEMRSQTGADNPDVAISYANLGRMQIARGDHTDGVIWLQKALSLAEKHLGTSSPQVAEIVEHLACSYYETGQHELAEPLFWKAYKIKSEYLEVTSSEIATLLTKLADMYNKDGKYTLADSVLLLFQQETQSVTI